jgi:hypothetical protein
MLLVWHPPPLYPYASFPAFLQARPRARRPLGRPRRSSARYKLLQFFRWRLGRRVG